LRRRLRRWRRQIARRYWICETLPLVRSVAKWRIRGVPAPAQRHRRSATQPERLSFLIDNLKISLHAQGTVAENR
jgi:hypothetical protein